MLLGLIAAACAGQPSSTPPSTTGSASKQPSPPTTPSATSITSPSPARTATFQVWFVRNGKLFLTRRTQPFTVAQGRASLEAMLAGPSAVERSAGVRTSVPSGTRLLGLTIRGGVGTVDFSGDFRPAGDRLPRKQIGQVVYTLGQFSTVKRVAIRVDGDDIFKTPQTKAQYEDVLPAIVVETPTIGSTVSSPVRIAGTANVFEATVSLRILDQNGKEIARSFTTATCGTGCRGDYAKSLSYNVSRQQQGTIEVFEESAENGEPINVVKIPVTLTP